MQCLVVWRSQSRGLQSILILLNIFQPIRSEHLMIRLANCCHLLRCCLRALCWFVKQNLGISQPTGFWQTETGEAVQPIRPYYSRGRMCMHVLPGSYSRTSNISFKNALRFRYTYLEYKFHLISQYGLYMIPCVSARSEDRRSITRPCFLHPPESGTPQNITHWQ